MACACRCDRAGPDRLFEAVVAQFRDLLLAALAAEPPGPARRIRAYIRASATGAMALGASDMHRLRRLFQDPEFRGIWSEFADEACAGDTLDDCAMRACRHTLAGLWRDLVFGGLPAEQFCRTGDLLLLSLAGPAPALRAGRGEGLVPALSLP